MNKQLKWRWWWRWNTPIPSPLVYPTTDGWTGTLVRFAPSSLIICLSALFLCPNDCIFCHCSLEQSWYNTMANWVYSLNPHPSFFSYPLVFHSPPLLPFFLQVYTASTMSFWLSHHSKQCLINILSKRIVRSITQNFNQKCIIYTLPFPLHLFNSLLLRIRITSCF